MAPRAKKLDAPTPALAPTTVDEAVQCLRDLMPEANIIELQASRETYSMSVRARSDSNSAE